MLKESHTGDLLTQLLYLPSVPVLLVLRCMVCAAKHWQRLSLRNFLATKSAVQPADLWTTVIFTLQSNRSY